MSRDGTGRAGPPPDSGEPTPVTAGDRPLVSVPSDEERSRILDQLPVPVAYFGRDMVLALANRAAGESVDRPVASLLGLLPGEIEPGLYLEGGKGLVEAIERVLRTGQAEPYETQLTMKGSEHIWQAAMSPVRDAAGEVQGVSVVILDTTEQVRARRRLALLNKAGMRIGSTLDVGRTAEELAELAVEDFADFVTVDLLSEVVAGDEARSVLHRDSINFHRAAQCSVLEGCPESVVAVGDTHAYEPDSVVGRTLIKGEPTRMVLDDAALRRWTTIEPARSQSMRDHRIHSVMVVPLKARGIILGTTLFCFYTAHRGRSVRRICSSRPSSCHAQPSAWTTPGATHARGPRHSHCNAACCRAGPPASGPSRSPHATSRTPTARGSAGTGSTSSRCPARGSRWWSVTSSATACTPRPPWAGLRTAVRTLADVDLAPDELLTQLDDLALALDREQPADGPEGGQVAGATCLYAVYDPATGHCTMARALPPRAGSHPSRRLRRTAAASSRATPRSGRTPLRVGRVRASREQSDRPVHGRPDRDGRRGHRPGARRAARSARPSRPIHRRGL